MPSNNENVGQCRLCGQQKPLCDSHIVPELAYQPIKNEKNQIYVAGNKTRIVQRGYTERLLCRECDTILLSRYETKFNQVWMKTIPPDFRHLRTKPLEDVIQVDIPDYDSFKLFHLSVFWRAAISIGFKTCPDKCLGPYESILAEMIRNGNPGQVGDFPFLGILVIDGNGSPVPQVIQLAQGQGRFEDRYRYYGMNYAFCDWTFVVARPGPQWLVDLETRCRNEKIYLLLVVPITQSKMFRWSANIEKRFKQQAGSP